MAKHNPSALLDIHGRIYPVSSAPTTAGQDKDKGHLDFVDVWYPVQVKQEFDCSRDALADIDAFFRKSSRVIVALTVERILNEQIARKLA